MCVCLYNQKSLKDQPLVGKLILDELNSLKEESGEESLKSLSQVISWLAVTLVLSDLLKPVQPTHFDQYDERSFLLTQSELFTGGINVENLDFLSQTAIDQCSAHAKVQGDMSLMPPKPSSDGLNKTQSRERAFIHEGKDVIVDHIIQSLQAKVSAKGGLIKRQGEEGGALGMKICRATFAVIIKLNLKLSKILTNLFEDIDLHLDEAKIKTLSKDQKEEINQLMDDLANKQDLEKVWSWAIKMRSLIQAERRDFEKKYEGESKDLDASCETHIAQMIEKFISKAELLIKLEPPQQNMDTEPEIKVRLDTITRKPSYVKNNLTLKQQANEAISKETQVDDGIQQNDPMVQGVFSCLQSKVTVEDLRNRIQNAHLEATRRYVGLNFMKRCFEGESVSMHGLVECLKNLQLKKQSHSHYLDGLQGCSQHLQEKIRDLMGQIYKKLCEMLATTPCKDTAFIILQGLQWKYQARDFKVLLESNIFTSLSGETIPDDQTILSKSWCKVHSRDTHLRTDLMSTFCDIFLTVLSRISNPNLMNTILSLNQVHINEEMKLKKNKSVINDDVSSLLVDSAIRVIFRALNTTNVQMQKLAQFNDQAKASEFKKLSTPNKMHDLIQTFVDDENVKVEEDKPEVEEDPSVINISLQVPKIETKKDKNQVVKSEEIDSLESVKEKMKKMYVQQAEEYTVTSLIGCLKMFTSLSKESKKVRQIVKLIANPYYVHTLLQLLEFVSHDNMRVICEILVDLKESGVPLALLDDSQQSFDSKLFGDKLLDKLFDNAKRSLVAGGNYDKVKIVTRTMLKIGVPAPALTALLERLPYKDHAEQALLLILCDAGAEFRYPAPGDNVLNTKESGLTQSYVLMSSISNKDSQKTKIFDQVNNKSQTVYLRFIDQPQSENKRAAVKPTDSIIKQLIRSNDTCMQVKVMLLNMLISRRDQYKETISQLSVELQESISTIKVEDVKWQLQACERSRDVQELHLHNYMFTQLLEYKVADQKAQLPKNTRVEEEVKPRTLVKQLYKSSQRKQRLDDLILVDAHMKLYCVSDCLYRLTEDPVLKEQAKKAIEKAQHQDTKKLDRKLFDQTQINGLNKELAIKRMTDSEPLNLKVKNSTYNFNQMLNQEIENRKSYSHTQDNEKVVLTANAQELLRQKTLELLFISHKNESGVCRPQDEHLLWNFNQFYCEKKKVNFTLKMKKQGLTKQWLKILQDSPVQFKTKFIQDSLRYIWTNITPSVESRKMTTISKSADHTDQIFSHGVSLVVIGKMILQESEHFMQKFAIPFIETSLARFSNIKREMGALCRILFKCQILMQKLIKEISSSNDKDLIKTLLENSIFKQYNKDSLTIHRRIKNQWQMFSGHLIARRTQMILNSTAANQELETSWSQKDASFNQLKEFDSIIMKFNSTEEDRKHVIKALFKMGQVKKPRWPLSREHVKYLYLKDCNQQELPVSSPVLDESKTYTVNLQLTRNFAGKLQVSMKETGHDQKTILLENQVNRNLYQSNKKGFRAKVIDNKLPQLTVSALKPIVCHYDSGKKLKKAITLTVEPQHGDVKDLKIICVQDQDTQHLFAHYKSAVFALLKHKDDKSIYSQVKLTSSLKEIKEIRLINKEFIFDSQFLVSSEDLEKAETEFKSELQLKPFKQSNDKVKCICFIESRKEYLLFTDTHFKVLDAEHNVVFESALSFQNSDKNDATELLKPEVLACVGQEYENDDKTSQADVLAVVNYDSEKGLKKVIRIFYHLGSSQWIQQPEFLRIQNQSSTFTSYVQNDGCNMIFAIQKDSEKVVCFSPKSKVEKVSWSGVQYDCFTKLRFLDYHTLALTNKQNKVIVRKFETATQAKTIYNLEKLVESQEVIHVSEQGSISFTKPPQSCDGPIAWYSVVDTSPEMTSSDFSDSQIKQCSKEIRSVLSKFKEQQLKNLLKKKDFHLEQTVSFNDFDTNQSLELVRIVLSANQYIYKNRKLLSGMFALPTHYKSEVSAFKKFFATFAIDQIAKIMFNSFASRHIFNSEDDDCHENPLRLNRVNSSEYLFEQLFKQQKDKAQRIYSSNSSHPFSIKLTNEGADDAGGPFRDAMDNISTEIQHLFFEETVNLNDIQTFKLRKSTGLADLQKFKFIGQMIGWVLNSNYCNLALELSPVFWKRVLGEPIGLEDIQVIDTYRYNVVKQVQAMNYPSTFSVDLGTGDETELCPGGADIDVTPENVDRFVALFVEKYFEQDQLEMDTVIDGIRSTSKASLLLMMTPELAQQIAFSEPRITPKQFMKNVRLNYAGQKHYTMFTEMVKSFNSSELGLLAKFISGSSRLSASELSIDFRGGGDNEYPIGHTCGNSVEMVKYSTLEVMKKQTRIAISTCGEIDADGYARDDGEGNGEGEDGRSEGEGEDYHHNRGEDAGESDSDRNSQQSESDQFDYPSQDDNEDGGCRGEGEDHGNNPQVDFYGSEDYDDENRYGRGEGEGNASDQNTFSDLDADENAAEDNDSYGGGG